MFTVVFVCTGNTCRSPMAEVYLKALCERMELPITVRSAGVAAFPGAPASDQSVQVMAQQGIDLADHRSSALSRYLMDEADLVVAMTRNHEQAILGCFPEYAEKVETLLGDRDVSDPFGGTPDQYQHCFMLMKSALDQLAERIKITLEEQG